MKKILLALVILSILFSGCSPIVGSVMEPSTGTMYNLYVVPEFYGDGRMANTIRYELIPTTPLSIEEQNLLLEEWGYKSTDEVQILTLDADFTIDDAGNLIISSLPLLFVPSSEFGTNPDNLSDAAKGDCRAFAVHAFFKHVGEAGLTALVFGNLLADLANGLVKPTAIGVSPNGDRAVIKLIYQGVNIILIIGKSLSPTLFPPASAARVSALLKGLTRLAPNGKKALGVMASAAAFMKCVKDNWPKQEEMDQARKDHDARYGEKLGQIPANFPESIPVVDKDGKIVEINLNSVSLMTPEGLEQSSREEIRILLITGIIVLSAYAVPLSGPPALTLTWATQLAH